MKRTLAALAIMATPAAAQQSCFTYDQFQSGVMEQGLSLTFSGMTGDQTPLLQIYTRQDGAWIFVSVALNGVACLISGGQTHDIFALPLPGVDG